MIFFFAFLPHAKGAPENIQEERELLRVVVFDAAGDPVAGMPVEIVDISGLDTDFIKVKSKSDQEGVAVFEEFDFQKFKLKNGSYHIRVIAGKTGRLKEKSEITVNPDKPVVYEVIMPHEGEYPYGMDAIKKLFKHDKHRKKVGY